jgi:RHS repeat-associated protein
MPVTNYYTLDGGIVAERTGSERIDYYADALGSVVRSSTSNGGLSRQYRYKPYGSELSSSGSGTAPRYRWVGTLGYRPTWLSRSDHYVRARHYGSQEGRWTTVDPLWPFTPATAYAYSSPTVSIDPEGLLSYRVTEGPTHLRYCGVAGLAIKWVLNASERDGWIVQEVQMDCFTKDCNDTPVAPPGICCGRTYWEAWRVKGGRVYVGHPEIDVTASPYHDLFLTPNAGVCRYGTSKITGWAKFVRGRLQGGFVAGSVQCAGMLMATNNRPGNWTRAETVKHQLTITYGCCCANTLLCMGMFSACPSGPCLTPPTVSGP